VDNPYHEDVDLADILGTNWPKRAGAAAMILNNKSKSVTEPNSCEDTILKPTSPILTKVEPEEPIRKYILLVILYSNKVKFAGKSLFLIKFEALQNNKKTY